MDRFRTLEPVKLYAAGKKSSRPPQKIIGRLPSDLHLLVVANLTIPDIPAYARCCKATAAFIRDDSTWGKRWKTLLVDGDPVLQKILDDLEQKANERANLSRATAPPTISVDDDFGDFADANVLSQPPAEEMGDFVGAFSHVSLSGAFSRSPPTTAKDSYKAKFVRSFNLLRPLARMLSSPPHLVLSELFAHLPSSLYQQAKLLRLLARFLSPRVQPFRKWESLYVSLRSAMDRYDSTLLAAFDMADGKDDEPAMREAAESSWEIWDSTIGDWEMGKVWAEKREIFYQHDRWQALDNFTWVSNYPCFVLCSKFCSGKRSNWIFVPWTNSWMILLLQSTTTARGPCGSSLLRPRFCSFSPSDLRTKLYVSSECPLVTHLMLTYQVGR